MDQGLLPIGPMNEVPRLLVKDTCTSVVLMPWHSEKRPLFFPFVSTDKAYGSVSLPLKSILLSMVKDTWLVSSPPFHCPLPPHHRIWEPEKGGNAPWPQLPAVLSRQTEPTLLKHYYFARPLDLSTSMASYLLNSRTFFNSFLQQSGIMFKSHYVTATSTSGTSASWV